MVDTRDGSLTPDVDLALADGRITAITPTADQDNAASPTLIDAAGKFVAPGYLKMHTHVLGPDDPPTTCS